MEMRYCRRCGTELTKIHDHTFKCQNDHTLYLNPSPTVGLFLFDENDMLLLSVRGMEPYKGMLDCFGGFVDGTESIEQALEREMREELELEPKDYTTPVYYGSAPSPYPFGGEEVNVLSNFFYAHLKPGADPKANDDVAAIHRARIEDVSVEDIANQDIKAGFTALRDLLRK